MVGQQGALTTSAIVVNTDSIIFLSHSHIRAECTNNFRQKSDVQFSGEQWIYRLHSVLQKGFHGKNFVFVWNPVSEKYCLETKSSVLADKLYFRHNKGCRESFI
jgi:hypothetical protein